jgi:hypothetical protein
MDDFLFINNWFEQKYKVKSDGRYITFKTALNLFKQTGGENIVETGTTRMVEDYGAGYSTVLFGDFISHYGGHLWTVDINRDNMDVCRLITAPIQKFISYEISDSHQFLKTFNHKIDLLYLDSFDYPLDGSDPKPCQEHQLIEFGLAEKNLTDQSIVLLDDNSFDNGGKLN